MLWSALQALPPRQRAAIVRHCYEDLTEAQTEEAMGRAVGTVKSQVARGRKRLREQIGPRAYPADFLACDLPDGSCSVVSSDEVSEASFSLPVGDPMDT